MSVDLRGCFHAVHISRQRDIHQDQVGASSFRLLYGLLSRGDDNRHIIPKIFQIALYVQRNDAFIFDDQNPGFGHCATFFFPPSGAANLISNVVPSLR